MNQEKRDRQKANRAARAEAEIAEERSERRRKQIIKWTSIIAAVLIAAFLYNQLSGDSSDDTAEAADDLPSGCPEVDGSSPRTIAFDAPQPMCIDTDQLYVAEFDTSVGPFEAVLDPSLDATSVNNFIVLARYHAYDDTRFHRVIRGFVAQGGDVEDRFGLGGPGYRFRGAFPEDDAYRPGTLAMANTGDPSSNGSQFFIITGPAGVDLDPLYSHLGQVTTGLDTAIGIQDVPTEVRDVDGRPAQDVPVDDIVVNSITIRDATAEDESAYEKSLSEG